MKEGLIIKLWKKMFRNKTHKQEVCEKIEQPKKHIPRNKDSALEFQNEINNELWLNDQGC